MFIFVLIIVFLSMPKKKIWKQIDDDWMIKYNKESGRAVLYNVNDTGKHVTMDLDKEGNLIDAHETNEKNKIHIGLFKKSLL